MSTDLYIHRYDKTGTTTPPGGMPIPPVAENMEKFNAGAVTIGVEFRILTDDLIAAMGKQASPEHGSLNDHGVSLHVFVKAADGDLERLRFDCFKGNPHYHYISWSRKANEHIYIDPNVHADILAWSLDTIRTRLPRMLEKAGLENAEQLVDRSLIEQILPLVTESAYRARFHADKDRVARGAFADTERLRA